MCKNIINHKLTKIITVTIIIFVLTLLKIAYDKSATKNTDPYLVELKPHQIKPQKYDPGRLFNIPLKYLIQPLQKTEENDQILAVFIVTSYFGNVETRSAIRRSFSHLKLQKLGVRRFFLLGDAPNDKYTTQKQIIHEAAKFNDIIQGSFVEAYKNLTYKHIMGLKWVTKNYMNAKYVVKMDDDTVVNFERFLLFLKTFQPPKNTNFIAGYVFRNTTPKREPANKWYVPFDEYPHPKYPPFASGWLYFTTPSVVKLLTQLTITVPYFWIDDLYVTGLLAQQLSNVRHVDLNALYTPNVEILRCCMQDARRMRKLDCDVMIGPNGGDNNMFYDFNEVMADCNKGKCENRTKPVKETCVAEKIINLGRGGAQIREFKLN